eukprot:CAMPEP_0119323848 /NCGR_PEP_ID=MMETSP1333-20130426/61771_1 /TAXON_ID=418940 /ORGANISM="Scyphosphaera apsteinii, Strain RCC1455" /LENGTH=224 /DNA_ID=CAMNT_0007331409 /DNA_START=35 /DNA_END=709 /DNA_ORIENTATION=+
MPASQRFRQRVVIARWVFLLCQWFQGGRQGPHPLGNNGGHEDVLRGYNVHIRARNSRRRKITWTQLDLATVAFAKGQVMKRRKRRNDINVDKMGLAREIFSFIAGRERYFGNVFCKVRTVYAIQHILSDLATAKNKDLETLLNRAIAERNLARQAAMHAAQRAADAEAHLAEAEARNQEQCNGMALAAFQLLRHSGVDFNRIGPMMQQLQAGALHFALPPPPAA